MYSTVSQHAEFSFDGFSVQFGLQSGQPENPTPVTLSRSPVTLCHAPQPGWLAVTLPCHTARLPGHAVTLPRMTGVEVS